MLFYCTVGLSDGAGWEGVDKILKKKDYNVSVVQNPTISLEEDVKATKRVLAAQDGPAILSWSFLWQRSAHGSWHSSQRCGGRVGHCLCSGQR